MEDPFITQFQDDSLMEAPDPNKGYCVQMEYGEMQILNTQLTHLHKAIMLLPQYPEMEAVIIRLISERTLINAQTSGGVTPLTLAAARGQLEIVSRLVAAGADIELGEKYMNLTPIKAAAEGNHPEVLKYLLLMGADSTSVCKQRYWLRDECREILNRVAKHQRLMSQSLVEICLQAIALSKVVICFHGYCSSELTGAMNEILSRGGTITTDPSSGIDILVMRGHEDIMVRPRLDTVRIFSPEGFRRYLNQL